VGRLWWLLNGGGKSESARAKREGRWLDRSLLSGARRVLVYEDMTSSRDLGGYRKIGPRRMRLSSGQIWRRDVKEPLVELD
jgi:hypothetical protein